MRRCPSPLVSMKVPWVRFSPTARPMAMGVSLSLRSWKTSAGYGVAGCEPGSTVAVEVVAVDFLEVGDDAAVDFEC